MLTRKADGHGKRARTTDGSASRPTIDKLEAKLDKAENALERSRAHLSKLESDYESAWSDSFKERCQEWIDEEETRIRDIEASIDKMRGWLDEERSKLR